MLRYTYTGVQYRALADEDLVLARAATNAVNVQRLGPSTDNSSRGRGPLVYETPVRLSRHVSRTLSANAVVCQHEGSSTQQIRPWKWFQLCYQAAAHLFLMIKQLRNYAKQHLEFSASWFHFHQAKIIGVQHIAEYFVLLTTINKAATKEEQRIHARRAAAPHRRHTTIFDSPQIHLIAGYG